MSVAGLFGLTNSRDRVAAATKTSDLDHAAPPPTDQSNPESNSPESGHAQPDTPITAAEAMTPPQATVLQPPSTVLAPSLPERLAPMLWAAGSTGASFSPANVPPMLDAMPGGFNPLLPLEVQAEAGPIAAQVPGAIGPEQPSAPTVAPPALSLAVPVTQDTAAQDTAAQGAIPPDAPPLDKGTTATDRAFEDLFETAFAGVTDPVAQERGEPAPSADRPTSGPASPRPASASVPARSLSLGRRLPWLAGLAPTQDGDLWATPRVPALLSKQGTVPIKAKDGSIVLWVPPEEALEVPLSWQGRLRAALASDRLSRLLQVGVLVSFGTAVGSVLYGWTGDRSAPVAIADSAAPDRLPLTIPLGDPTTADPALAPPGLPQAIAPPETQDLLTAFHRIEWNQQRAAAVTAGSQTLAAGPGAGFPAPVMVERLYYGSGYGQPYGSAYGAGQPYGQPYLPYIPGLSPGYASPLQPMPGLGESPNAALGGGTVAPVDRLYGNGGAPATAGLTGPNSGPSSTPLPPVPLSSLAPDPRLAAPAGSPLPGSSPSNGLTASPGASGTDPATPPTPLLMGILENGNNSLALFKVNGVTQRIAPGESVGDRGWVLLAVAQGKAIVEYRGRVLALAVGQGL